MRLASSLLPLALAAALGAQDLERTDRLGTFGSYVQPWVALHVAPGREAPALADVRSALDGWTVGPLGSLVQSRGEGTPHRVVACGIDETAYVVSHVTDDGYLRVHLAGARALDPRWNAWHLGQRVVILTAGPRVRAVAGVFAVRSTHLWRRVAGEPDAIPSLDDLWIDVGARSRAEVAALGIELLDPVFRDAPDWSIDDAVVGPHARARAGCAAVAAAATQAPTVGRTTFVISTHSAFAWGGLNAVVRTLGDVDSVFVAHPAAPRTSTAIGVEARFPGTLVETLNEASLRELFEAVSRAAAVPFSTTPPRARVSSVTATPFPSDSLARFAEILARLTNDYSVSGDERSVRAVIQTRLPAWAREKATVDTAGNLVLAMGPDRDTVVFVAHMDETGFDIVRREGDVFVLRQRGGFYPSLYAGQPALMHGGDGVNAARAQGCRPTAGVASVRGVFLPGDSTGNVREVRAWFGALANDLVVTGLTVTGYKCAARVARTRFTARGIDDRLGSAALVMALDGIDTTKLRHKVVFLWATREEVGLLGARAAAAAMGPSVRRVHTVDTFVSADSPLETGRFAVTPIGEGAVVRVLDNASVAPPDEVERVRRIARAARIPLQVGTTNGGTDGSAFVPFGAYNVAVSWPLRYSHSPVELIDLRDMRSLVRLITALALAPQR